jgi:hypothetical protein
VTQTKQPPINPERFIVPFSLRVRGHFGAPVFEGAAKSGARILEIGVWRRALMATEDEVGTDRETQAEVDVLLAETGVTMEQVKRWRREGLLPDVVQDQQACRGSVVLYPKGTCAQIQAARALFKQKNRVDYVGLRLWRLDFPVDEKFWKPRLKFAGRIADRVAHLLPGFVERFDRDSSESTFSEAAAAGLSQTKNIVLSRIKGRVEVDRLPAFVQTTEEVGRDDFVGFGHVVEGEEQIGGRATTVDALDLQSSERDSILGRKLNLFSVAANRPQKCFNS